MLNRVVDLHDVRVFDPGEEAPLDDGGGHGRFVTGVEQALEHNPAVVDVAVPGQIYPAHAPMGQAAGDLVLTGHQVALGQSWA